MGERWRENEKERGRGEIMRRQGRIKEIWERRRREETWERGRERQGEGEEKESGCKETGR